MSHKVAEKQVEHQVNPTAGERTTEVEEQEEQAADDAKLEKETVGDGELDVAQNPQYQSESEESRPNERVKTS